MVGKSISHYKILEQIGQGGMGVVYKAEDTKLKRTVALKFLAPELTRDDEAKKRLLYEARAASSLDHANICSIHEIDETDEGQVFIAMAWYDGESLKKRIEQGPLKLDEAIDIATQMAAGLQAAHEKGIVHRDIKCANVIITSTGQVKIMDFGLAKMSGQTRLTMTGTTMGTAAYMSPEQARGEKVDHRTDIWSLGVMIYEMITGQLPFKGDYEQAIVYGILNETPEPITGLRTGVPMELERIVDKLMSKDQKGRYQHADEISADLSTIKDKVIIEKTQTRQSQLAKSTRKKLNPAFFIIPLIIVISILSVLYLLSESKPGIIDSLAVLPLQNLTGEEEKSHIVDGIHGALITELSKIEALKVISRTSAMRYRETDKTTPDIAKELNVRGLVEGSVQFMDNHVIISANLIDANSDRHLWAGNYEGEFQNILSLQKEVARAIASEIQIKLTPQDEERIGTGERINSRAHNLYLKGKYFLNRGTETDIKKGMDYFWQAIEENSNYALAYAGLAEGYKSLVANRVISPKEGNPLAIKYSEKALDIDDSVAEAHLNLAFSMLTYNWDWQTAKKEFRRALELNPNSADARWGYSWYLSAMGQFDQAILEIERAKELEPVSSRMLLYGAWIFYHARQYDKMISWAKEATEIQPNNSGGYFALGYAYLLHNMFDEAVQSSLKAVELSGDSKYSKAGLAVVYGFTGKIQEAKIILDEIETQSMEGVMPLWDMAKAYVTIDEIDHAFEYLEKAYVERSVSFHVLKVDPLFDRLHSDPRYDDWLKKIGFEE